MRLYTRNLNWTSTVTFAALAFGCTLETVPVGENDAIGSGSKGSSENHIPSEGTGAAGGDGDAPAGTGASGGDGDAPTGTGASGGDGDGDAPASTGASGGDGDGDAPAGTGASGGAPGEDPGRVNPILINYCEMEASCISSCMVEDGVVPCDTPERQRECLEIEVPSITSCELGELMWLGCMAELSCAEVELFFAHYPDNIKATTPCAQYLGEFCDDWEPPTEYSFD